MAWIEKKWIGGRSEVDDGKECRREKRKKDKKEKWEVRKLSSNVVRQIVR
jgi:hypothetical protein